MLKVNKDKIVELESQGYNVTYGTIGNIIISLTFRKDLKRKDGVEYKEIIRLDRDSIIKYNLYDGKVVDIMSILYSELKILMPIIEELQNNIVYKED